jgi:hypothetical protein
MTKKTTTFEAAVRQSYQFGYFGAELLVLGQDDDI